MDQKSVDRNDHWIEDLRYSSQSRVERVIGDMAVTHRLRRNLYLLYSIPSFMNMILYNNFNQANPCKSPPRCDKSPLLLILQSREVPHIVRRTFVPARVVVQIKLMIVLRVPPLARLQYLGRNRPTLPPLLLRLLGDLPRLRLLLWGMVEDGRAVLCAHIHALTVFGSGIVHLIEEFKEGGVLHFLGIEDYLE